MQPEIATLLTLISGISWTLAYIILIRRGFADKTYGMPLFALSLNLSWEFLFAFVFRDSNVTVQGVVNIIWCLFDVVIVYTYFRYGRKEFAKTADLKWFLPWSITAFVVSFAVIYFSVVELGVSDGAAYTAFTQNLLMSVLFINLLVSRRDVSGQSIYVALLKWIGTAAPTILFSIQTGEHADPRAGHRLLPLRRALHDYAVPAVPCVGAKSVHAQAAAIRATVGVIRCCNCRIHCLRGAAMRVALFTETFLPKIDGIVTVVCLLLDHLEKRGIEAVVVAPKMGVDRYKAAPIIGVPGVQAAALPGTAHRSADTLDLQRTQSLSAGRRPLHPPGVDRRAGDADGEAARRPDGRLVPPRRGAAGALLPPRLHRAGHRGADAGGLQFGGLRAGALQADPAGDERHRHQARRAVETWRRS